MEKSKLNENVFNGLAEVLASDYRDLPEYICEISKDSSINNSLLAYDCMTANLIYYYSDMTRFAEKLAEKAQSGMTTVGIRKHTDRMNTMKEVIKLNVHKKTPMEDMITLLQVGSISFDPSINLAMENAAASLNMKVNKDRAATDFCINVFRDAQNLGETNPLVAIMGSIVLAKTTVGATKEMNEFEKMWEPAVIALIETGKVPANLRTDVLRKQTIGLGHELLATKLYPYQPSFQRRFEEYFHDLAVSNIMRTTSPNRNLWDIGMEENALNPMIYVDADGNAMALFDKARYMRDKKYSYLVKDLKDDNLYTLIRKLQGRVTGKQVDGQGNIGSSVSEAENIAKVLLETFMLIHQENRDKNICPTIADMKELETLRAQKELLFALANPLYEALNVIDKETAMNLIADAVKDVDTICKEETNKGYDFVEARIESTADAQTEIIERKKTGRIAGTKQNNLETQVTKLISKIYTPLLKDSIKGLTEEDKNDLISALKDGKLVNDAKAALLLATVVRHTSNELESQLQLDNAEVSGMESTSSVAPSKSTIDEEEQGM